MKRSLLLFFLLLLPLVSEPVFAAEEPPSLIDQPVLKNGGAFVLDWNYFTLGVDGCSLRTVLDELQADGGGALEANELWLREGEQWKKYTLSAPEATLTAVLANQILAFSSNQKFFFDLDPKVCQAQDENRQEQIAQLRQGSRGAGPKSLLDQLASIPLDFWKNLLATLGITSQETLPDKVIYQDINVLGKTTLSDLGVTGKLNVGLLYFDDLEGSVNSLKTLKIQNNLAGNVEFLGGLAVIDTNGNLVLTSGKLVLPKSTGQGIIKAGQTEVSISNSLATPESKIFTSPLADPGSSLFIKAKANGSFTVGIGKAPSFDLVFDWWIIN
ncbi:hypothetical protein HY946_02120 [Candidatus Gottesmanbacteria bacterium]|nr:hypothetical protein [Candidatus Gottesmanbacteria bacterium]